MKKERNYISSLSVYLQKVRKEKKIKVHLHGRIYKNFRHVCLFLMINLTVSKRKEIVMEQEQICALDEKREGNSLRKLCSKKEKLLNAH